MAQDREHTEYLVGSVRAKGDKDLEMRSAVPVDSGRMRRCCWQWPKHQKLLCRDAFPLRCH